MVNKIAFDWIRTANFCCRKQPLYQLCHNYCPGWLHHYLPKYCVKLRPKISAKSFVTFYCFLFFFHFPFILRSNYLQFSTENISCHLRRYRSNDNCPRSLHLDHSSTSMVLALKLILKKKWANPSLFLHIFSLFKQTIQFLQQINVKNVHPVYSTGIRTHDLSNMSRHP